MSELKKGRVSEWRRTFTEQDIRDFAALSGDKGRHHLEPDAQGRLMAHGLLTATLPTKLGGDLDYIAAEMTFEFLRPVYAGEEMLCRATTTKVKNEKGRLAVCFTYVVTNPRGKVVLKGNTRGVIREKAPPAPPKDRGEFMKSAPQARAALVAGLKALLPRATSLSADENGVLVHVLAYAGYGEDGRLRVPSLATLWGEAPSYVPAVRLEPVRVAAAVRLLVRRGVLKPAEHDVWLDDAALRSLAA